VVAATGSYIVEDFTLQWTDIKFDPPTRTLRQFAGLSLLIFGLAACYQGLVRHHPIAAGILGTLALGIGIPGLIRPSIIRPIYVGAMILSFPIGWTVSKIILACVFFGLFTPISLWFRLIGRDALHRRRSSAIESYWMPKDQPKDPSRYFQPF
jgi:hypothetical protein